MVPDEAVGEQHADTASGDELIGGIRTPEKVFEQFLLVFLRNTDAGIADGKCPVSLVFAGFYAYSPSL